MADDIGLRPNLFAHAVLIYLIFLRKLNNTKKFFKRRSLAHNGHVSFDESTTIRSL
jgi:hypothetical protein